jgi:hypothetical protein
MKIVIDEKQFDRIFSDAEREFQYDHEFMKPTEIFTEFKKSKRYYMLLKFRASIARLKQELKNA